MNHVRRALGFVAFAVSLAQTWSSTAAAQGAARSRSAALLIGAGAGRYPFTPLPGARDSKPLSAMLTAGVEGEFADNWNWLVEGEFAFNPGACADVCPSTGPAATASVQRRIIAEAPERIGIAFGPSLFYTDFDGAEVGAGVRMDIGVLRRIGPRLGVQYGLLSGGHSLATVHVMLRLGNLRPAASRPISTPQE